METKYDPARTLTNSMLIMAGILVVFVCVIIAIQIQNNGVANTESWAALTGIMGFVTAKVGDILAYRFNSTQQSANKDQTISQQARTAAVTTDALLDPNVSVTNTGDGSKPTARATMVDPEAPVEKDAALRGAQPLVTENIHVEAQTATITEAPTEKERP